MTRAHIDAWFASHETRTFGALVAALRRLTTISDEVETLIKQALRGRNHLAHHFFREHAEDFVSVPGIHRMIEALRSRISLFQSAQRALESISAPIMSKLGVTQPVIDALVNDVYERTPG